MSSSTRSALVFAAYASAVAALGVFVVYGGHIHTGLYYDDYHFARPLGPVDLRRVWFGSWDPAGIEPVFYRPIAAWMFAARFWLFGVNATAMHTVSLAGHGLCAVLVGWFLRRERKLTNRPDTPLAVALLGVWVYAIHPAFPYAQSSWLTNQMHLANSIIVITTLIVWQDVRDRPLVWWTPIAFLTAVAFLIKEDGVMLLPAIIAVTLVRAWTIGAPPRRSLPLLTGATVCMTALVLFRHHRLGRLGGYALPDFSLAQVNFWKGLEATVALWPTRTPWQGLASAMAIGTLIIGLGVARWRRDGRLLLVAGIGVAIALSFKLPALFLDRPYPLLTWQALASGAAISVLIIGCGEAMSRADRRALFVIGAGLAIAFCFNAPFLFVSKREQYHLVALGAVLVFAGAGRAVWPRVNRPAAYLPFALLLVATMPLGLLARATTADFLPCGPAVLDADAAPHGWWVVPDEIKTWLDQKSQRCASGLSPTPMTDLPIISWGVYADERDASGEGYRWTSDRAVLLARQHASAVTLALRRADATPIGPVHATITASGTSAVVTLDSSAWKFATVRLRPNALAWLRAAQRVDITVSPWFVPAVVDPLSSDLRRHGVELRIVSIQ
jgi:hypothetical protein